MPCPQQPEQTWFGGLVFKAVAGVAGSTRGSVLSSSVIPPRPPSVVSLPSPARLTHYAYAGQAFYGGGQHGLGIVGETVQGRIGLPGHYPRIIVSSSLDVTMSSYDPPALIVSSGFWGRSRGCVAGSVRVGRVVLGSIGMG